MDSILQGLLDLSGVNAALVVDGSGHLAAFLGKAVYDRALCEQAGATLLKAVDSLQLQQEDWETVAAQFTDGKLLLRSLGASGGTSRFLVVVADATLNPSFATVALRVAANKLKKAFEGGGVAAASPVASQSGFGTPYPAPAAAPRSGPSESAAVANTGVSWSKMGSSVTLTGITVNDPASATFLSRCTKELARAVGPMSKVYVQEAIRRLSPEATYTMALRAKLVEDLAAQIEDGTDRDQFLRAAEKL